jgi:3-phenylpropionate/cinnamic acid dioxygenase small subunit
MDMKTVTSSAEIRPLIEDFYTQYNIALDDLNLEAWPEFFEDTCLYKVTTKENWDADKPLSTIRCESKGMLNDRVVGLRKTMMFAPRYCRRFQSALQISPIEDGILKTRSNFLCVQTLVDEPSEMAFCGVAYDKISLKTGEPIFMERICVLDTEMISNSLIYPL